MGGRGASSGISVYGKKYGTEYHTIKAKDENGKDVYLKSGNIKFIMQNKKGSVNAPMETMTKGWVYVLVSKGKNQLSPKSIIYFDTKLKRIKQIDLRQRHKGKQPHVHVGYEHNESYVRGLTPQEKTLVAFVRRTWDNWVTRYGAGGSTP